MTINNSWMSKGNYVPVFITGCFEVFGPACLK
jgi:hypothetical protein